MASQELNLQLTGGSQDIPFSAKRQVIEFLDIRAVMHQGEQGERYITVTSAVSERAYRLTIDYLAHEVAAEWEDEHVGDGEYAAPTQIKRPKKPSSEGSFDLQPS
jgi:hypothetical protein